MAEVIFCQWVDGEVSESMLPEYCLQFVIDGRCIKCEKSPQLDLGMSKKDLLRNIKDQ